MKRQGTKAGKTKKASPKSKTLRILLANGVNLDLLGTREPEVYGKFTLADVETAVAEHVSEWAAQGGGGSQATDVEIHFLHSNDEAEFLANLTGDFDGFILNPGAWTHTSLALADRLKGIGVPYVEVHISNTLARESFRHQSFISAGAVGVVIGFGLDSYRLGAEGLLRYLQRIQL